ncbi:D-alanine--D-alanine ligase [Streptomyces sp. NPDC017966]|jgi:D-alanine-D-alanine ligase|uniref:D-alanine--D-alanine ligase n=2 Tax=Methylobacterium TaxID=407 RepID=A0A089NVF5_9HYPH|nr:MULTISPECIES: D-alanine--D-alanine ligase [Methylobacterium]AIQ90535.1 D-alanine-D-alanine ligase [Methylobacterium oryzae CBMB20]AWV17329.1 D-alanine--D-alanine ligase [Methylobacterium sp. XJLW]MBA9065772.1 D-alanine-D-alanine ligase [Methylobacterium fujisawaense]MBP28965.1 D-alanine--D-alanine ligase [Methylobacterium sp.]MDE4912912.1 D-alanine--D-alanine ligase [Methylobacterium sp. 092160098-2]
MSKHVAVLLGGTSAEREVSLSSGKACADALEGEGYRVTRVDVGPDIASVLTALKPDVAFNALHGPDGEDGTIQGLLEILRIPYTHSGVLASALAMNKEQAKTVMRAAGVDVPEGRIVNRREAARTHPLPPPYVVKPIAEGSSVGVIIVRDGRSHPPQILASEEWTFGEQVLVEPYIAGRELTCGVMGDRALGVIEVKAATGDWYDYDAKYAPGGSVHVLPAELKPNVYQRVQELSLTAHQALGCRGVSRADLRYDDTPGGTGLLVVLEVNTQPGMTQTSLVPEMAAHAGLSFGELVRWMVEDASLNR